MKLPDLSDLDDAGLTHWGGDPEAAARAALALDLHFLPTDLANVSTKGQLLSVLAKSLKLPPYFGGNWDALADCIEDDDWIGPRGSVIMLGHSRDYRQAHATDWAVLEGILIEAADYWRERQKLLWILTD